MNKKVKKHLFNVLFVLFLLALTVFILLKSNEELSWADVRSFFSGCNAWYIAAAVGCMFVFLIAEAFSLKNIARKFGYKTKFVSALAYSSADAYYSALTPSATGGQPASAYYMVKDGFDGGATTFILVFNLLGYTAAIFVLGLTAFVISLFSSSGGWVFFEFGTLSKVLIIVGVVMQAFLIWLFLACLRHPGAVLKTGNARRKYYEGLPVTNAGFIVPCFFMAATCFHSEAIQASIMLSGYALIAFAFVLRFKMPKFTVKKLIFVMAGTVIVLGTILILKINGVLPHVILRSWEK